jgi:hypothetical protein
VGEEARKENRIEIAYVLDGVLARPCARLRRKKVTANKLMALGKRRDRRIRVERRKKNYLQSAVN